MPRVNAQRADDNACGPCVAVNVLTALGVTVDYGEASRRLLGTFAAGTSVEALVAYLNEKGAAASWVCPQPSGMFEACKLAVQGGAYAIPLLQARGALGHFLVVYGIDGENALVADSLPSSDGHFRKIAHGELEQRAAYVTRKPFGGSGSLVIARRV